MDQIGHQLLHVFSVNLGGILNNFFQKSFVWCMRDVCKRLFYRNKRIEDSFNFFCMLSPTKASMLSNFDN